MILNTRLGYYLPKNCHHWFQSLILLKELSVHAQKEDNSHNRSELLLLNLLPAEVSETNHRTIMIFSKICYLLKSVQNIEFLPQGSRRIKF